MNENMIHIKIANLAVNLNCSVLMNQAGEIALLQRFYDDEGKAIARFAPSPCNYRTQENWLALISAGDGRFAIC
jgi:hypothetical protein